MLKSMERREARVRVSRRYVTFLAGFCIDRPPFGWGLATRPASSPRKYAHPSLTLQICGVGTVILVGV